MAFRSVCPYLRVLAVVGLLLVPTMTTATAGALPEPEGPVILTVAGKIANTNVGNEAHFDMQMLKAMEQHDLHTTTPWTDGVQGFTGVLMRDLMETVGAYGENLRAVALNDYSYPIALADFHEYPVLLAHTQNGERLRIRDKGPLWIVYPRDQFTKLREKVVEPRMVWQLRRLVIQ